MTTQVLNAKLTRREQQITQLVAAGCSNAEIAERLGLRVQTVKNRLCELFSKTGVRSRVELAVIVAGIQDPPR